MASTYGAVGSLVVVLIWVYFSSQILFLGAVFTRVWALQMRGARPGVDVRRTILIAVVATAALLLTLRALLPLGLERFVNRALDRSETYEGSIGDVDVALWRGAYSIDDLRMRKRGGKVPVPFFDGERVDLSIEWRALFDGSLVGEVVFLRPQLNFVAGPNQARRQGGGGTDWRRTVESLFPIKINRVEVVDGSVHFRNFDSDPPVDVYFRSLHLVALNLTNSEDLSEDRVARIRLRAIPLDAGRIQARVSLDPFAERPSFDLDASLEGANLVQWNDFLRAYLKADVQQGSFSVFTELEARDGGFDGYLKPFLRDVDVLRLEEEADEQSLLASLWEAVVGATVEVLQDQEHDRVATRIPIAGTVKDPTMSFWATLGGVLRNAFLEAFRPTLEGSVGEN